MQTTNTNAVASRWFKVRVSYEKTCDDGKRCRVTEQYVVEALSFTEAEARITKHLAAVSDLQVKTITPAAYGEVFFDTAGTSEKYFKTKVVFVLLDEKTGKEKKCSVTYLVGATGTVDAIKHTDEVLAQSMVVYYVASVGETATVDVVRREQE